MDFCENETIAYIYRSFGSEINRVDPSDLRATYAIYCPILIGACLVGIGLNAFLVAIVKGSGRGVGSGGSHSRGIRLNFRRCCLPCYDNHSNSSSSNQTTSEKNCRWKIGTARGGGGGGGVGRGRIGSGSLSQQRSTVLILSVNLALTDCASSLITALSLIFNAYLPKVWLIEMESFACWLMMLDIFKMAGFLASILHLIILGMVHFQGITKPLHYRSEFLCFPSRRALFVNLSSLTCWLVPLAAFALYFALIPCQGFNSADCGHFFQLEWKFRRLILVSFTLPLLILTYLYTRIWLIVRRHNARWALRSSGASGTITMRMDSLAAPADSEATLRCNGVVRKLTNYNSVDLSSSEQQKQRDAADASRPALCPQKSLQSYYMNGRVVAGLVNDDKQENEEEEYLLRGTPIVIRRTLSGTSRPASQNCTLIMRNVAADENNDDNHESHLNPLKSSGANNKKRISIRESTHVNGLSRDVNSSTGCQTQQHLLPTTTTTTTRCPGLSSGGSERSLLLNLSLASSGSSTFITEDDHNKQFAKTTRHFSLMRNGSLNNHHDANEGEHVQIGNGADKEKHFKSKEAKSKWNTDSNGKNSTESTGSTLQIDARSSLPLHRDDHDENPRGKTGAQGKDANRTDRYVDDANGILVVQCDSGNVNEKSGAESTRREDAATKTTSKTRSPNELMPKEDYTCNKANDNINACNHDSYGNIMRRRASGPLGNMKSLLWSSSAAASSKYRFTSPAQSTGPSNPMPRSLPPSSSSCYEFNNRSISTTTIRNAHNLVSTVLDAGAQCPAAEVAERKCSPAYSFCYNNGTAVSSNEPESGERRISDTKSTPTDSTFCYAYAETSLASPAVSTGASPRSALLNGTSAKRQVLASKAKSFISTRRERILGNARAASTTLLILGTYLLCWCPAVVFYSVTCIDPLDNLAGEDDRQPSAYLCPVPLFEIPPMTRTAIGFTTNALIIFKTIIDSFIYLSRMKETRHALLRCLTCLRYRTAL